MICTACLGRLSVTPAIRRRFLTKIWTAGRLAAGLAVLWFIFYLLGSLLLLLPDSFHDGSIWQGDWLD